MATITRLYGWECGQMMIPSSDISNTGYVLISSTYPKTGTYGVRMQDGQWFRIPVAGAVSNPSVSVWVRTAVTYADSQAARIEFQLSSSSTDIVGIRWNNTTHTFDAYVNGVLVAPGTVQVTVEALFHVQFYAVIADAGSIQVKINGHLSIDYSGDTQPGIAATVPYVYFRNNAPPADHYLYFDDLVIGYGGFLGDLRCPDIRPNADTAVDNWTPSTGTDNYATIDETPPSDADYNEVNTDAQADELALGDFDGVTYNPVAVTAWVRAQMLAATGDSIKVGIDSGGVDDVTEWPLSTAWQYYFHTADANPADSAEWEDADIDALLLRYESVIA